MEYSLQEKQRSRSHLESGELKNPKSYQHFSLQNDEIQISAETA
jgi:hypothetical protein